MLYCPNFFWNVLQVWMTGKDVVARGAWFSGVCSGREHWETSGEKVGQVQRMITCVWLQWLAGRDRLRGVGERHRERRRLERCLLTVTEELTAEATCVLKTVPCGSFIFMCFSLIKNPKSPKRQPCLLPSSPWSWTVSHWCRNPGRKKGAATVMSTPSSSPFADVIHSLAGLHQEHHQALLDMREDQERRFQTLVRAQQEDRELFRSWMDREVRAGGATPALAPPTHMPLNKMGPQDDPEAFIDLFERTAEACGWPAANWPVRLIPLLSGEAQLAAQQLPVQNLLVYDDLKRAILQRVGLNPEQHRQRFRSLELGENGRPFVMAQQLRDACRKWLLAGGNDVDQIVDRVVLEQFIARLPKKTAQWVQCHRPTSLDLAIQLAEDQMVACHGVGEALPAASLSLSLSSPSFLSQTFPSP